MSSEVCPCCGQSVRRRRGLIVNVGENIIRAGHAEKAVPPRVAELLSILRAAYPEPVHVTIIVRKLYGQAPPTRARKALREFVGSARRAIWPLGFEIRTYRGPRGAMACYRLERRARGHA